MENSMILRCKNISFQYERGRNTLTECSFDMPKGGRLGLIGCNGAGKSTLLKIITGLLKADGGSAEVDGREVCKANLAEIRKTAGFVFQEAENQLFMPTVAEDVAFGPFNYGVRGGELEQTVTAHPDLLSQGRHIKTHGSQMISAPFHKHPKAVGSAAQVENPPHYKKQQSLEPGF